MMLQFQNTILEKDEDRVDIPTWSLPSGYSADSKVLIVDRISKYRFGQDHYLKNGIKIIPKVTTVMHILEAYDKFGLELAVSEGSYDVVKEVINNVNN